MKTKKTDTFILFKATPKILDLWTRGVIAPRAVRNVLAKLFDVQYKDTAYSYGVFFKLHVPQEIREKYEQLDQSQKEALASAVEQELISELKRILDGVD